MHALIAFALGPIGRYVVGGGIILAMFYAAIWSAEQRGAAKIRADIETEERAKSNAAKNELDRVLGGDDSRVRGFDRDE